MNKLMYVLLIVAGISGISYYCHGVDPVDQQVATDGNGDPDTHPKDGDEPCPPCGG